MLIAKNLKDTFFEINKFFFIHVLIIITFSFLYFYVAQGVADELDRKQYGTSLEQTLYYTIITHFTIGFGGIRPTSQIIRRLTMCQIILAFLFFRL